MHSLIWYYLNQMWQLEIDITVMLVVVLCAV